MAKQSSELLDRLPPQNLDAEKAVLGSVMLKSDVLDDVLPILQAADFYADPHQKLFTHLVALHYSGQPVDSKLLVHWLKNAADYEAIGGSAYIGEVIQSVPTYHHAVHYAKIVRECADRRRLIHWGMDAIQAAHDKGKVAVDLFAGFRAELDTATVGRTDAWPQWTCAALMAADLELTYLVDGILVALQPCILAGPKKSLKTSLLLDLAVALVKGGYFLGRFNCPTETIVGVLSGESGLAVIQETLKRICHQAGYNPETITSLIVTDRIPQFGNLTHLHALRAFIRSNRLQVAILDPTYMAMSGEDAGNLFKVGAQLRDVSEICQENQCTMILAHHTTKHLGGGVFRAPGSPPELEDIAWAGFQEFARQWLLVSRREPYEPGTGSHRLWLSVGGSAGHGGLWGLDIEEGDKEAPKRVWDVTVLSADEARGEAEKEKIIIQEATEAATLEKNCQLLVDMLAKYPNGETATTLKIACGFSHATLQRCLIFLTQDNAIELCPVKKPNREKPYQGYRLVDDTPTTQ